MSALMNAYISNPIPFSFSVLILSFIPLVLFFALVLFYGFYTTWRDL